VRGRSVKVLLEPDFAKHNDMYLRRYLSKAKKKDKDKHFEKEVCSPTSPQTEL
jgi:hypothetical protein